MHPIIIICVRMNYFFTLNPNPGDILGFDDLSIYLSIYLSILARGPVLREERVGVGGQGGARLLWGQW